MSPTDWERFFAFVHECDRTSSTLSRQDVRAMIEIHSPGLIEAGNWLADFYEFGRKLLEAGPNPEAHRTRLTTFHEDSYLG